MHFAAKWLEQTLNTLFEENLAYGSPRRIRDSPDSFDSVTVLCSGKVAARRTLGNHFGMNPIKDSLLNIVYHTMNKHERGISYTAPASTCQTGPSSLAVRDPKS